MTRQRFGGLAATALKSWVVTTFLVLTVGCTTREPIQNVSLSYNTLKTTLIRAFPTGLKEQSRNGRTLIFNYFDPENWSKAAAVDAKERAFAVVVINGSSRPYNLDAFMVREKRDKDGKYGAPGPDPALTKKLIKEIKALLANRREDRNVIDGFRPF